MDDKMKAALERYAKEKAVALNPHLSPGAKYDYDPANIDVEYVQICVAEAIISEREKAQVVVEALQGAPNPNGGTLSIARVMKMVFATLNDEGHRTLAMELLAIIEHQRAVLAQYSLPTEQEITGSN